MKNIKYLFSVNKVNQDTFKSTRIFSFGYTVRRKYNNPKINDESLHRANYQFLKGVREILMDIIPGGIKDVISYMDDEKGEYSININEACLDNPEAYSRLNKLSKIMSNLMLRFEKQLNNPNTSRILILFNLLKENHVVVSINSPRDENGNLPEDTDENHSVNDIRYCIVKGVQWDEELYINEYNTSIDLKYYNHYYK